MIMWIRRIWFVSRLLWDNRGRNLVRYYDVRAGREVVEFVDVESEPLAASSGKGLDEGDLSQSNRGGRG